MRGDVVCSPRFWRGYQRLLGAIMITLALVMLLPIYATVTASVKRSPKRGRRFRRPTFRRPFRSRATRNSGTISTACHAISSIHSPRPFSRSSSRCALQFCRSYALARFPIPGKEALFVVLLTSPIIPYQALLTPIFLMFAQVKLTNSLVGLAIIHTAIQLPFSLYIMRNSFEAIPKELEEAAVIDGCNTYQLLLRICIPSVVPSIVTVALFAFITSWNEPSARW